MPWYDWSCKQCGKETAVERPSSEYKTPPSKCECGSEEYGRVIKPTPFHLHGDGWFRDQYVHSTGKSVK